MKIRDFQNLQFTFYKGVLHIALKTDKDLVFRTTIAKNGKEFFVGDLKSGGGRLVARINKEIKTIAEAKAILTNFYRMALKIELNKELAK